MAKHTSGENVVQQKNTVSVLEELLEGGHAHVKPEDALAGLPVTLRDVTPEGLPYNIWQLAEHIRITQWDILEFSRNPKHVSPQWPEGYWPSEKSPANDTAWQKTLLAIKADKDAFLQLLRSPGADLYTPFEHGNGQNLLREAMLIANHTSYHTGQIILIRRLLGAWN